MSADPTSAPLCRLCCHQQKIDHSDELQTKGWTCSACNGYNPSTEVRSVSGKTCLVYVHRHGCLVKSFVVCSG